VLLNAIIATNMGLPFAEGRLALPPLVERGRDGFEAF
jgi:hypothetical protein